MAGIVSAIADDDERFFAPAAVLEVVESLTHGVVERGPSARGDGVESFLEFLCIAGKSFSIHEFDRHIVIEIHNEHFVLRINRMREGGHRGNDTGKLWAHAPAVVNNKANRDRVVSFVEYRDLLQLPVFKNAKIVRLETSDGCAMRVSHIYGKQNKIHRQVNFRLRVDGCRRMLRQVRWREADEAEEKQKRSKEQVSIAQMMLARVR